jgi:hypothetical protein
MKQLFLIETAIENVRTIQTGGLLKFDEGNTLWNYWNLFNNVVSGGYEKKAGKALDGLPTFKKYGWPLVNNHMVQNGEILQSLQTKAFTGYCAAYATSGMQAYSPILQVPADTADVIPQWKLKSFIHNTDLITHEGDLF